MPRPLETSVAPAREVRRATLEIEDAEPYGTKYAYAGLRAISPSANKHEGHSDGQHRSIRIQRRMFNVE
jgi:hypothetical protein